MMCFIPDFACFIPGFSWMLATLSPMLGPGLVPRDLDLKLLKELTTDLGKNEAISPFVMSTLMTQVWLAANGTTRDEMTSALGIKGDAFLLGYQSAIADLKFGQSSATTKVFNGIYAKKGFSIKPNYVCTLDAYYSSKVEQFSSAKEGANAINTAVANTTNNLIPELVTPASLEGASFALVSALYFKGQWYEKFNNTDPENFLTSSGEKTVDMMRLKSDLPYMKTSSYDCVSLQYSNCDYSMLLLRPLNRSMEAVQALRDSLDKMDVQSIANQLRETSVEVKMPRFRIETKYDELEKVFPNLGIKQVFSADADLSNMASEKLQVEKVVHKVVIEVNEEGTVAAGAGAVVAYTASLPVSFILDRPFFAIVWNWRHMVNMFTAYVGSP
ncbi:leukocyte elastase inhibitor-like isoform X1 [Amphibalanus amphitrite]|uniref:leukocyte elastase inhibitor-like isoform X1 n=1 Tax=Amphibalanus amphitrite TaxID=1232801 RepID=UPI001C8FF95D|nr:leukocyte elastase inhibitor-like isoform X1 [Amphibalanus amphitrite]